MVVWNKNDSQIYESDGSKIVSKNHQKLIFLHRELFFYDLFQKNPLVKTPKIHSFNKLNLQTYFIETEEKNILQTAIEWAKVHSYFMKNPIENPRLFIQHDIKEVIYYVLKNIDTFGELSPIVKNKLSDAKMNKELTTILHGDLQNKNMVTFKGDNYYFDFELGGLGHPGRDIVSMIISNPDKKEELITTYKQNINFDYLGMEEDINTWLMARTTQLYLIFDKREGTIKQKKFIKDKLSRIIQNI